MQGTFEVHLITNPDCQPKLFGYITNLININPLNLIRPRPTCSHSLYGDYPVQPMLTFWIYGDIDTVTKTVKFIEADMIKHDIPIIRTKIESMAHNKGVPDVCTETKEDYFEFHFKVDIVSTKEWNDIVNLITPFGGHLFYNPYNKSLNPIATIRRYTSLEDVEKTYAEVIALLEENGYTFSSPEKEYSVYDSNVSLDKNWLFKDEPTNFIRDVSENMLFPPLSLIPY